MEIKTSEEKTVPADGQPPVGAQKAEALSRLSKDPYFLYLVQSEVETRTRAHLGWWWKIIAGTLGVVVAAITLLGYREYSNISTKEAELNKTISEVNESAAKAKKEIVGSVDESKAAVDKIGDAQTEAQGHIAEAQKVSQSLIAEERAEIQDLVGRLFERYANTQKLFEEQNRKTLKDNEAVTEESRKNINQMSTTIAQGDTYLGTLKQKENELDKKISEGLEKLTKIEEQSKLAAELSGMKDNLQRARAFQFVFLESHDSKTVEIENPGEPGNPFKVTFISNGLANNRINLSVQMNGQTPQPEHTLTGGVTQTIESAQDVGLVFDVVAVRHRRMAHDFAILKVYYNDRAAKPALRVAAQQPTK